MSVELAPAKINMCLFLGPVRGDGRHALVSVMQSISLSDKLDIRDWGGPADVVLCPDIEGPNLASQALAAFRAATGWDGPPQLLTIDKRVPIAGGLGGGSGDAAAALRMIARRAQIDDEELLTLIAASLGADVPAQVRPGRVVATGAGEKLQRLADPAAFGVLVLPSSARLSTPDVYAQADRMGLCHDQEYLDEQLKKVLAGDIEPINELAPAAIALEPSIEESLAYARLLGAHTAMVSGSGPTVFGLFRSAAEAVKAAALADAQGRAASAATPVESPLRHN